MTNGKRILLADDNHDALAPFAELLRDRGHRVAVAFDRRDAVEVAERFRPDVAIMDLDMPRMTGHEAARHLRRQPWGISIMLVAVSGWGDAHNRASARDSGFDHHFLKPANLDEVTSLVESGAARSKS